MEIRIREKNNSGGYDFRWLSMEKLAALLFFTSGRKEHRNKVKSRPRKDVCPNPEDIKQDTASVEAVDADLEL
jgi:hypothetical protein